jgi:hypothetical protein
MKRLFENAAHSRIADSMFSRFRATCETAQESYAAERRKNSRRGNSFMVIAKSRGARGSNCKPNDE